MRESITPFLVAASVALATSANQLMAGVIPPIGLVPGQQYQLVFVTAFTINGFETTEASYNGEVISEARANPLLPVTTWHAVTSTADGTSANVNAPWLELPVYNTQGILVSDASTNFYSPTHANPITYDQFGAVPQDGNDVWTGSNPDGSGGGGPDSLGASGQQGFPLFGLANVSTTGWMDDKIPFLNQFRATNNLSLYALSGVLTVPVPAPEPASLTLLGVGFVVIGGMRLLRRRKR